MRNFATLIGIYSAIAISGISQAEAVDASFVLANLKAEYSGTFLWHDSQDVLIVSITLNDPISADDGNVLVHGVVQYSFDEIVTGIGVTWHIDPDTLRFEMFERDPNGSGAADIVTTGSYVGEIAPDLLSVWAIWTTAESGDQGTLSLTAAGQ